MLHRVQHTVRVRGTCSFAPPASPPPRRPNDDAQVTVDKPGLVAGKRVVCVEDGPTTTHGGMPSGAALVAAQRYGAGEVVDPRPFFVGELAATLAAYPHLGPVVPAVGYSAQQVSD